MLYFRSEDHLDQWLDRRQASRGAVLALARVWPLARAWYPDRRDPGWHPRTVNASQAILDGLGLSDPFWKL